MPTLPGVTIVGRPDELGQGPGLTVIDAVAALPATTAPRPVLRIYAGKSNGTPRLVWASVAQPATGAARSYVAGGQVVITWTVGAVIEADAFDVRRPDGSLVGTLTWSGVGTFVGTMTDTAPRPIGGSYTVTARLGGTSSAPTAAASLNLAADITGLSATWNGTTVTLGWTAPSYGQPSSFNVYRLVGSSFVLAASVAGNLTAWDDTTPIHGDSNSYKVIPVLSGLEPDGFHVSTAVAVNATNPTPVSLTVASSPGLPGIFQITFIWSDGPGVHTGYERYFILNGVDQATATTNSHVAAIAVAGGTTVYARVRALSGGGPSSYVGLGPITAA